MTIPTVRLRTPLVVALAATVAMFAAACGDESDDASTTTAGAATETTVEANEFLDAAEERGKPTVEGTDPVEELVITDDVEGTGAEVQPGDVVTAHYVGVSASTRRGVRRLLERRCSRSASRSTGVIQGWTEGLVGMKEGGRRTLVIPADLAYGDTPPPGAGIAAGETLVFTIDLVAVESAG